MTFVLYSYTCYSFPCLSTKDQSVVLHMYPDNVLFLFDYPRAFRRVS